MSPERQSSTSTSPDPKLEEPDAGFTLIEAMVALAVLSLTLLALMNLVGESVRTAGAVEDRLFAEIVAQNRIVTVVTDPQPPAIGETQGREVQAGRSMIWRQTVSRTPDPALLRVEVRASMVGSKGSDFSLTAFRKAGP